MPESSTSSATRSFRNSAAFGKRIEYWIIARMLKEGMDVYVPLVDDHAGDAIVRRSDGSIALIQIKARSKRRSAMALCSRALHTMSRVGTTGSSSRPLRTT